MNPTLLLLRSEMFVTSKLWNEYHSPGDVEGALLASLRNLNLDYLDLYLMHWPFGFKRKNVDTYAAIDTSGKVRKDPSVY